MHFLDLLDIVLDVLGLFEGRDEKKKKRSARPRVKRTTKVRKQQTGADGTGKSSKVRSRTDARIENERTENI